MAQYFRGPFGLWPFPIINQFMSFFYASQQRLGRSTLGSTTTKGFHNLERFEIKYDKATGDPIEIIVHRKVEPNE